MGRRLSRTLGLYWEYYLLILVPVIYYLVFLYLPIAGNVIAFRRYAMGDSIFGSSWAGLRYFKQFMGDGEFWRVFANTLRLSVTSLVFGFPAPIIFAILINEVGNKRFKRSVQLISYMPHFLSMVIVIGILQELVAPDKGTINQLIIALGGKSIDFMTKPQWFRTLYIGSSIWQDMGWSAIIYLAALTGIDPQLYEAAAIDGANRWNQTVHVTFASILPTVTMMFIMAVGRLVSVGYEKVLLMYNEFTMPTADVISTFVFRKGIQGGMYSYATAVGLFEAVIAFILVFTANAMSRRLTESALW